MIQMRTALWTVMGQILWSTSAVAGSVFLTGQVSSPIIPVGGTGTLEIRMNLDPLDNFQNGGITFSLESQNPGVIEFTSAEILNPSNRWTIASETVSATQVDFTTASVLTPGLPTGGQNVLFATVTFKRLRRFGISELNFIVEPEALFDGRNLGIDVTANYSFQTNFVAWVPEPGSMALAGIGLIGLAMRRHNG